jgi:hypothetical protein
MMTEEEFWAALQPIEMRATFYRLYHDEQGFPLFFSQEDLPGNYIEVDKETFSNSPNLIRVIDGKLVVMETNYLATKLKPVGYGTCCHPHDVSVVVDEKLPNKKWNLV